MVDTSQGGLRAAVSPESTTSGGWPGWGPLSGIAFVVFFVATSFMSDTPSAADSNAAWTAWFASAAHRDVLTATGFTGLVAALALLSFIVNIWTRVAVVSGARVTNPLPVAAAAVAAAAIASGALLQAVIPGAMVFNSMPEPSPGIIRVLENVAGPLVFVGGMIALALAVASLALQARAAGAFGKRLTIFSLVVAVLTVFSFEFFPVLAPLVWVVTVSIILIRRPALIRTA
jgi:hypothetical protein